MIRYRCLVAGTVLMLGSGAAVAQNVPVYATGALTPGHLLVLQQTGTPGSSVTRDAGPALAGNVTELGITNDGLPFCIRDKSLQHIFCVGANALGGGLISYNPIGSAAPLGLTINLNGVNYPFPGAGGTGNAVMPTNPPIPAGDLALANGGTTLKDGGAPVTMSVTGGDPTGAADSTTAIQNCLNAVGPTGTCSAGSGLWKVLGNLTIPAQTNLMCSTGAVDGQDNPVVYGTLPRIMLDSAHTISAGGAGVGIDGCLIVRNGMTFPAPNSSAYVGNAVNDQGFGGFSVVDSTILGFDSAIVATGDRGKYRNVYMDGAGVTHAVWDWQDGNTDSGTAYNIKIQPFGTGNGNCSASQRLTGTGFRHRGIDFVGDIVVQNFLLNYDLRGGQELGAGTHWSDGLGSACGFGSTVGVQFTGGHLMLGGDLNLNGTQTGVIFAAGTSPFNVTRLSSIFLNIIGQDGIVLGGTGGGAGIVDVGAVISNPADACPNCSAGRFAINYADSSTQSVFNAQTVSLQSVNNNAAPYISSVTTNAVIGFNLNISNLYTNLTPGVNPYSGFNISSGGQPSVRQIVPTLGSCTGASVSCALLSGSDVNVGVVQLTVGASAPVTGTIPLTFPFAAAVRSCSFFPSDASGVWTAPSFIVSATSTTAQTVTWKDSPALTAGNYNVTFNCAP